MAAPKNNTNAEKWTLEESEKFFNDIVSKIESREIQYISELNLYFNTNNGGANYILSKLKIKEKVVQCINTYTPNRVCLYKNNNRGCKIKANKRKSIYIKKRRQESISYKLRFNFSSLFRHHFKNKNGKHTFDYLDYNVEQLKGHLQKLFKDKMNWNNYGTYWHIDHIKPASLFNHENINEVKMCWSLSNLQPLEAYKNMSKGNRYET